VNAHEGLCAFLLGAPEDLALLAVHLRKRDTVFVFITHKMQYPVAKTIVELFFEGVFVFLGLRADRRKAKRNIPEEVNVFTA
jgi:hypothetical protein